MDIQTLAKQMLNQFETKTRDSGEKFVSLKDGHEEWMQDVARNAHGRMLPDDARYEMIKDSLYAIIDGDDIDDARESLEPSTYNADLLAWVSSSLSRAEYVNQAVNDGLVDVSSDFSLFDTIRAGQHFEMQEVFDLVVEGLEERLSEVEE